MQISSCFCKTCICLKILENIEISVTLIDRLDITDEYSVKCDFILNTIIFIDAALNISLRKFWNCNVLWFYLFGQGVPNEIKMYINLKLKCQFYMSSESGQKTHFNRMVKTFTWPVKEVQLLFKRRFYNRNKGLGTVRGEVIISQ